MFHQKFDIELLEVKTTQGVKIIAIDGTDYDNEKDAAIYSVSLFDSLTNSRSNKNEQKKLDELKKKKSPFSNLKKVKSTEDCLNFRESTMKIEYDITYSALYRLISTMVERKVGRTDAMNILVSQKQMFKRSTNNLKNFMRIVEKYVCGADYANMLITSMFPIRFTTRFEFQTHPIFRMPTIEEQTQIFIKNFTPNERIVLKCEAAKLKERLDIYLIKKLITAKQYRVILNGYGLKENTLIALNQKQLDRQIQAKFDNKNSSAIYFVNYDVLLQENGYIEYDRNRAKRYIDKVAESRINAYNNEINFGKEYKKSLFDKNSDGRKKLSKLETGEEQEYTFTMEVPKKKSTKAEIKNMNIEIFSVKAKTFDVALKEVLEVIKEQKIKVQELSVSIWDPSSVTE